MAVKFTSPHMNDQRYAAILIKYITISKRNVLQTKWNEYDPKHGAKKTDTSK